MTVLYRGKFLSLTQVGHWEYCTRSNASGVVIIVALNKAGQVVLTEQFRPPVGGTVIEFPAGLVGDEAKFAEESLEDAASRELLEETGYAAPDLKPLMAGPTSAGMTDEVAHFFLAKDAQRIAAGGGTGEENIQVHEVALDQCAQWLQKRQAEGVLVDPKVYACLYFLNTR